MANTIILKRSATPGKTPTTSQLALGEIAINTYDGKLFIKKDNGTPAVVEIGGVTSVNTHGGDVVLTTSDINEGSNLYFTTARARSALSAGTGISYNSSTGAISTSQSITTSASPTFAGLTLTGNMGITGSIVPSADNTYSLGSATYQWKDIFVGPGSLYVNGKEVISDQAGTMTFSSDPDQNMRITTTGTGVLQLGSSTTNVNIDGTLQIQSGKNITDSAGVKVNFGDNIEMNGNKVIGLGTPSANTDAATKKYVDDTVGAISTSSITKGDSNVTVTDTGTGSVTVTVDGSTALTVSSTGVVVAGNFTVSGTTTTVNSNTVSVADNILTLNSDTTGTPTQNAGIEVERGDEANTQVRWNEGSTKWTFTNDGAVYYPMATGTDDLAEGSTNLYFTNGRARGAISASSATGVSYNSSTGAISLGSIPNSSLSNNSITINGTAVALGGTRTLDTDAVSEGSTNKYFSNTLARGAVSVTAGTGISYNSSTGAFSLGSIPNASLTNSKVTIGSTDVSLGGTVTTFAGLSSVTSTTFVGALTGNASTATTLQTARNIQGVSFDGSANITVLTAGTGISVSGTAVSIDTATTVDKTTAQTLTNKTLSDSTTYFADETDSSKKLQFQLSSITTATTRTLTVPDVSGTIVTTGDTGTVTNTMLAGSIANAKLANSSVTVGTTAISLGASSTTLAGLTSVTSTTFVGALTGNASTATTLATARAINGVNFDGSAAITIKASTTNALTIGTGLTGTSFDGGSAVTIAVDSTIATKSYVDSAVAGKDNTDEITEGSTNLYFTNARARSAISVSGSLSYNSTTGVVSYTTPSTSGISEGSNLYYTDARARAAVSFTAGSGGYNSTTGVITIPTNTNQLTNGAGFITGYTETDTLASVTGRGATTTAALSTGALTVSGAITATGEITAYYSDANLKKDIVEIQDPIAKVMSLRGVTFRPNETALALGIADKEEVGVIAQEVEAVLPQLVAPSAFAGFKTVRYEKLTALLLEAVKAQQLQIDALRAEISKLGGSAKSEL